MKAIILGLSICLYSLDANCQSSQSRQIIKNQPTLIVNRYVNNKEKRQKVKSGNIVLKSRIQNYTLRDSADLIILPFIAKNDTLDLSIKLGHRNITMNKIPGWRLQPGAAVSIGQIDDFTKVISIAKDHNHLPTDADYEMWNNRYSIAPAGSIIDLPNTTHIKQVDYIILAGYGHGSYIMQQQIWWK